MIHQMDELPTACNSNCNSLLRSKLELSNQHACPCLEHSKLSYLLTSEAFIYRNLFNLEFDKTLDQSSFLSTFECSHKNCFPKFFNTANRKTKFCNIL